MSIKIVTKTPGIASKAPILDFIGKCVRLNHYGRVE
jgi:hypothetical protein